MFIFKISPWTIFVVYCQKVGHKIAAASLLSSCFVPSGACSVGIIVCVDLDKPDQFLILINVVQEFIYVGFASWQCYCKVAPLSCITEYREVKGFQWRFYSLSTKNGVSVFPEDSFDQKTAVWEWASENVDDMAGKLVEQRGCWDFQFVYKSFISVSNDFWSHPCHGLRNCDCEALFGHFEF